MLERGPMGWQKRRQGALEADGNSASAVGAKVRVMSAENREPLSYPLSLHPSCDMSSPEHKWGLGRME